MKKLSVKVISDALKKLGHKVFEKANTT